MNALAIPNRDVVSKHLIFILMLLLMEAAMSDYTEFILLSGLLALAGIVIMANLRIELWCERWLERWLMQPLHTEPTSRLPKHTAKSF